MIDHPNGWLWFGIDAGDAFNVAKRNDPHQPSSTPLARLESELFGLDAIDAFECQQETLGKQRDWEYDAHAENKRHHATLQCNVFSC
jgi:hypothetical protein